MERPFDTITQIFADNLERVRDNLKTNFEQAHAFILWLVGFSIGGLGIIIANLDKDVVKRSYGLTKFSLILFTISIISGIVYRLAIARFQGKFNDAMLYAEGAFSNKEMMSATPTDLTNESDIRQVIRYIKEDYGEDLNYVLELYGKSDDPHKEFLLNDLKEHYNKTSRFVQIDIQNATAYAKAVNQKAFGLSNKVIEKAFSEYSSRDLLIWRMVAIVAFYISCVSFVSVPFLICILY